jgi:hypothetical protein
MGGHGASALLMQQLLIMLAMQRCEVRSSSLPQLNGFYSYDGGHFLQKNGEHVLVRLSKGYWGFAKGKTCLAKTDDLTSDPCQVRCWKTFRNGKYVVDPGMTVTVQAGQ